MHFCDPKKCHVSQFLEIHIKTIEKFAKLFLFKCIKKRAAGKVTIKISNCYRRKCREASKMPGYIM